MYLTLKMVLYTGIARIPSLKLIGRGERRKVIINLIENEGLPVTKKYLKQYKIGMALKPSNYECRVWGVQNARNHYVVPVFRERRYIGNILLGKGKNGWPDYSIR